MPISAEIRKKIKSADMQSSPTNMVNYLKNLIEDGSITADDIYSYTTRFFSDRPGLPYILQEKTINLLGVMLGKLNDKEQKSKAPKFYKLAGDRGCAMGCKNYARSLLEGLHGTKKNATAAIEYFEKAIVLYENNAKQKYQCQYHLALALREDGQWEEANKILVETFAYYQSQIAASNDDGEKANLCEERQKIIDTFNEIIGEFSRDFNASNIDDLYAQWSKNCIAEMAPILSHKDKDLLNIQLDLYYLKGQYHELLNEDTSAWKAYCVVKDSAEPCHTKLIAARAELLKKQVAKLDVAALAAAVGNASLSSSSNSTSINDSAYLQTSQFWKSETPWFDAVDTKMLKRTFKRKEGKLDEKIAAKKIKKKSTATLDKQLENLDDKNDDLSPSYRKIYRRRQTESNFFKPERSKKKTAIINLVNKIIDQRYRAKGTNAAAIDLTGISSRILITAERAYQEAVLSLRGSETTYKLGIPQHRKDVYFKTEYGPIESYKVGSTTVKVEHRANPDRQRLGDSFINNITTYTADGICGFLNKMSQEDPNNESTLASYMIRYSRNHTPVTLGELQQIYNGASNGDVDKFHRICFLILEKEQVQWHSANAARYQSGMALAQARCLRLIEAGFIRFKEAFQRTDNGRAPVFGIYSGKGLVWDPDQMKKACEYIDKRYVHHLNQQNLVDHLKFFKANITDEIDTVLTRQQGHKDMLAVHGGDSDTDDDGYETELSM
jgi:hypothetical protein